jgi:Uma2 family endonuclease
MPQRHEPDAVNVSYDRWAKTRPMLSTNSWPVLPEICIEVISPTDRFAAVKVKMAEYFEAGVSQVWIIAPEVQLLDVDTSTTASRGFKSGEMFDASAVIPGTTFEVAAVL